jgi:AcrR family transcriptional regulator
MATRRSKANAAKEEATADPAEVAVDAMLRLAASRPWRDVTLADIAAEADLTLADLRHLAPSKSALVAAFGRRIDAVMLAEPVDAAGSVKDRLFDLIMRRFDALAPHREAVRAIAAGLGRDPLAALCLAPGGMRAMKGLAEMAGIDTRLPFGPLKIKALAATYLGTFRIWLGDDSADAAKTMAALDRSLGRLEAVASNFPVFFKGSRVSENA